MSQENTASVGAEFDPGDQARRAILEAAEFQSLEARAKQVRERHFSGRVGLDLLSALVEVSRSRPLTESERELLFVICDELQRNVAAQAEAVDGMEQDGAESPGTNGMRSPDCPAEVEELRSEIKRLCGLLGID